MSEHAENPADAAVLTERRGRVLIVTINRPEARNSVNTAVATGIAAAMDELDGSADLSVAVLTGAGGNFCSGMDLKAFLRGELPMLPGRGFAGITESPPKKPLIAAVEGYALAGGTEIALCADLIVASSTANFGIPEVRRGLVAVGGGLIRLPRRIPFQVAMELALTGENLAAADAHRFGLVNRITEPGGALATALELAEKIAANGPLAVAATKQVLVQAADWSSDEAFGKQMEIAGHVFGSEDAKEGPRAFAEKRAPVWQGR
ncbi:crotonase/enoyl-CoA hydratase family protein [Tomitella biformata]|uniref:crotonase/enoyl-CoA hydratase family protein n=1 Tax=Tomitella biformata TaxID=630403 RepID=UPI000463732C|nr:crotonase/enoyl-CoA hydratase family protein [Tomitella biformata]